MSTKNSDWSRYQIGMLFAAGLDYATTPHGGFWEGVIHILMSWGFVAYWFAKYVVKVVAR